jgi:hypothetical protein
MLLQSALDSVYENYSGAGCSHAHSIANPGTAVEQLDAHVYMYRASKFSFDEKRKMIQLTYTAIVPQSGGASLSPIGMFSASITCSSCGIICNKELSSRSSRSCSSSRGSRSRSRGGNCKNRHMKITNNIIFT